MYFRKEHVGNK